MKRKLYLTFVLVLILSLASLSAAFAQDEEAGLFRVEVRNRTHQPVSLSLAGRELGRSYLLTVAPGSSRTFTLREDLYDQTSFACGDSASGTLDVTHQLRLVFTPCPGNAPNPGAPTLEKVHLTDSPKGVKWSYQYGRLPQPGALQPGDDGVSGACEFRAGGEVTIYRRPSTASGVFSTQGAGFTIPITARTADGWLGFDPGVAQAANFGSFRLRWIEPGAGTLAGGCSLPVVWGPPAGVCFFMPMTSTNVYVNPDAASPVAALLQVGEFAAITGLTAGGDWAKVDLGPGNTGSTAVGWVDSDALNVNGPCEGLPTVTP